MSVPCRKSCCERDPHKSAALIGGARIPDAMDDAEVLVPRSRHEGARINSEPRVLTGGAALSQGLQRASSSSGAGAARGPPGIREGRLTATMRVSAEQEQESALAVLVASGGAPLPRGQNGVCLKGWRIESKQGPILKATEVEKWEKELGVFRLPEMVFGGNVLELVHEASGLVLHFSAWDALQGWRKEKLPPVQIPAAVRWRHRTKTSQELILDYDYTFTTTYAGSEGQAGGAVDPGPLERLALDPPLQAEAGKAQEGQEEEDGGGEGARRKQTAEAAACRPQWQPCSARIDLELLQQRDPILFYDEVVLYEDELADCGIALCSVKVRVMPRCWFVLLRFWLRVDGVLMRLRDTRVFSKFEEDSCGWPVVIRERCKREATFEALARKGFPADSAFYGDPNTAATSLDELQRSYERLVARQHA